MNQYFANEGGGAMYREGIYCGCRYAVNEHGDCFTADGKDDMVHREWRYNHDGYPIVSACGHNIEGDKIQRSLQVHILVAKQFVSGWFEGAEVNHKDFNRANPDASNLEWRTHKDNVRYSVGAGRYVGKFGEDNPNYGNDTLSCKYKKDKELAKEKQSRPRKQNGRARRCQLITDRIFDDVPHRFDCQRDAADWVIDVLGLNPNVNKEHIIKQLKRSQGYKGYYLQQL